MKKTKSLHPHINIMALALVAVFAIAAPDVFAAGGLDKVNDFMDAIAGILRGASVISVTVALMWAGYKFLFTQASAAEAGKIVIAGLLIGGASEIAKYLLT
ncbi:TrbC/VirB2 family protein [Photobacterium damselae]|uniref:TrbC/VirB2 family protein n=1 Tax=Photobacterium damselae TaxID=38293 RepID=UPI00165D955B|nr:TrbC/VirB2 family protein [Photobacterium damselae]